MCFTVVNTGTGGGTLPRYPGAMSLRHLKIIRHDFAKIYVKMGEILGNFNIFEGNFRPHKINSLILITARMYFN
jgi:hypothetical protein